MTSHDRIAPNERKSCTNCRAAKKMLSLSLMCVLSLLLFGTQATLAQTSGQAGIQGTVTDPSGAAVEKAVVTATNDASGVATTRETTGDGLFTISPIAPGTYTVTVKAPGFSETIQKNLVANALVLTPLNVSLTVGEQNTQITVTDAPPQLDTTNATLGLTLENDVYANLPLQMNNAQRDPTAFGTLAPGAQGGARLPIIGGTGNYLGQLYVDGLPAQTVSQQGDNRLVSQAVSVDAIDQLQVVTSTPPAEFSGAGAENFTFKAGGLKYHGQVSDFIRNTALDAWGFTSKAQMVVQPDGSRKPAPKPVDHQNEFSASFGGHVPGTKRVFFFVAYDKYHSRRVANAQGFTIPSLPERNGDFTELNCPIGSTGCVGSGLTGTDPAVNPSFLYDPTTTTCAGTTCSRQPLQGIKNGVLTNNVIPANYISPIAKAQQSFLPTPTNTASLTNNYVAGIPTGFDNHLINYRVDFDISKKHRLSTIGALGTVNYLNNFSTPYLPLPYTGGTQANIFPKLFDIVETYTISNSMVNTIKFGYVRFFQNIKNNTEGNPTYSPGTLGITNLPGGQASNEFPGSAFATTTKFGTALQTWTGNSNAQSTQLTTPNNYALVDNLQYVKGSHTMTFGISIQWQQINNANPATFTGILSLPYNANATANFNGNTLNPAASGYSYASFLLGAVGNTGTVAPNIGLQPVSELGGRYRPIAPYVEDTWKVNSKLTIDAGLRWDYFPPYREVKDRWSFMNPDLTNPATGTPGAIQMAGSYGGGAASCNCRTPVKTYWKNWGPRLGITFSPDSKTVFRAGIGHVFSQGGGVGGRGGASNGAGQLGFNTTATGPSEINNGPNSGPSFYLNNSTYFQSIGKANTSLFGPGYVYPTSPAPGTATQVLNSGNYVTGTGANATAGSVTYADPYFSGRAPNFTFYNLGVQEAVTKDLTLAINYVGNQSHHLINSTSSGSNPRGYWTNQLNPAFLVGLGGVLTANSTPILTALATPANVAIAQAAMPGVNIPASFQAAAAANNGSATIAQGLVAFPQYSAVSDIWGANVGNFSYNSLQVTLEQRLSKGLTFNMNYTWSKNIGDDGTFRSGFDIPSGAISGSSASYKQDRIERSSTVISAPHVLHGFGVYQLPFGKDKIGGSNAIVRTLIGGWQLSGIYTYSSGSPAAVIYAGCNSPAQGQCMPDVNPSYTGGSSARIGGSYGSGATGRTACNLGFCQNIAATPYFSFNGFKTPTDLNAGKKTLTGAAVSAINLLGNSPRTGAMQLTNPGAQNIDTSIRRTFKIYDAINLQIEVDCLNTWNHTIFSNPNAIWAPNSTTFGTITGVANNPRNFQLAAHLNF